MTEEQLIARLLMSGFERDVAVFNSHRQDYNFCAGDCLRFYVANLLQEGGRWEVYTGDGRRPYLGHNPQEVWDCVQDLMEEYNDS